MSLCRYSLTSVNDERVLYILCFPVYHHLTRAYSTTRPELGVEKFKAKILKIRQQRAAVTSEHY